VFWATDVMNAVYEYGMATATVQLDLADVSNPPHPALSPPWVERE